MRSDLEAWFAFGELLSAPGSTGFGGARLGGMPFAKTKARRRRLNSLRWRIDRRPPKAAGVSVSSAQRIWRAHGLAPHRVRRFKLSSNPEFVLKLKDIVGLYVDPPAHAVLRR